MSHEQLVEQVTVMTARIKRLKAEITEIEQETQNKTKPLEEELCSLRKTFSAISNTIRIASIDTSILLKECFT